MASFPHTLHYSLHYSIINYRTMQLIIQSIAAFLISIIGTAYLIPKIISIVKFKKLMDNPNERSSHDEATPSLGGMAFYIVLVISLYFNYSYDTYNISISIFPALTILFFLGLKDDLVVLAPKTKLIGQIIASSFVVLNGDFEIGSFYGFLGIGQIPFWISLTVGFLIMITVINAFNLIDGIDGLAASIGIVAFSGFSLVFFFAERHFLMLTCLVMVGILVGFLFFNISSKRKIFMGDTGSMLIGFVLGVMSLRFLSLDAHSLNRLPFNAVDIPIVLISFLIVPLFDTARVFAIRILNKKGPFSPDRNHLHHVLIDSLRISHRKASFFIAMTHITCVVMVSIVMKTTNGYFTFAFVGLLITLALLYLSRLKANPLVKTLNAHRLEKEEKTSAFVLD